MSTIIHEKWYHEGAPPVWVVECPACGKVYRILERQRFMCYCEKSEINIQEYKPSITGSTTGTNVDIKM